jgi:hypothetical protein
VVKKEISFIENDRIRVANLQILYEYISAIAPSSVESEKSYFAINQIHTKTTAGLKHNTIDCLCFLSARFIRTGIVGNCLCLL